MLAALALAGCDNRTDRAALEEADHVCGGRADSVTITVVHHGTTEVVRYYEATCEPLGRTFRWSVYPPAA